MLPLTTKLVSNSFPLRIRIPLGIVGLRQESDIMIDQMLAWDNSLFRKEIAKLPDFLVEVTKLALKDFLDL